MSREHAPAVKELTDKIVSFLITTGITASADRGLTEALIADPIEVALAPLTTKSREACIALVSTKSLSREHLSVKLDAELARWEPPKTEAK